MTDTRVPVIIPEGHERYCPPGDWPESPDRVQQIASALTSAGTAQIRKAGVEDITLLSELHSPEYLTFLQSLHWRVAPGKWVNPDTDCQFAAYSKDSSVYGFRWLWQIALSSANSAVIAAKAVKTSRYGLAFSLSRPPGHHAGRSRMGGFCYLGNAAVAASIFKIGGRVAILDVDFHHGDGTQELFYRDPEVSTVSIHGDPRMHYPYRTGFPEERGAGPGTGTNTNIILPDFVFGERYLSALDDALETILSAAPSALVVSLGFDTFHRDPLGAFSLDHPDFHAMGMRIARLHLPTVAVLEGGYHDEMGVAAVSWVNGFIAGRV